MRKEILKDISLDDYVVVDTTDGSNVVVDPIQTTGKEIAKITVNDNVASIFIPEKPLKDKVFDFNTCTLKDVLKQSIEALGGTVIDEPVVDPALTQVSYTDGTT